MTILVDQPVWPWRGRHWAHLVSDVSYDELHEFARRLGLRRLGFQGDHYDIDEVDHRRAVALGVEQISGRELIRRLRAAGLRNRDGKPRWEELQRWPAGVTPTWAPPLSGHGAPADRLRVALVAHGELVKQVAVAVFADTRHLAALVELHAGMEAPTPAVDVDLHVVGGRRADETSSIELFVRR